MGIRLTTPLVVTMLWLLPAPATAHQGSVTYLELAVQGRQVTVSLRASRHHLAPMLGVAEGINPVVELFHSKRDEVLSAVAGYLTVMSPGRTLCVEVGRTLVRAVDEEVALRFDYRCARRVEQLTLRYDLLFDADPRHRAMVRVSGEGRGGAAVLSAGKRDFVLERRVSPWVNAGDYLLLGVEHIFTGYDHVVFLVGLLLAIGLVGRRGNEARGVRQGVIDAAKVVTAFTAAHSVTLIGAALNVVSLPGIVVESAIALSIAYIGLENIVVGDPRRRWLLTFAFGLVHGFGFAHVLAEIGLPRSGLVLSLAAFNLGVELGQLTLVTLLLPLVHLLAVRGLTVPRGALVLLLVGVLVALLALSGVAVGPYAPFLLGLALLSCVGARRLGYRDGVLRPGSALIAGFGLLWAAQRIFGFSLFSGWLG